MTFNPTKQQCLAINEKGNVLVCAAAGSGKTAVLVERVIGMLTDSVKPVSADRLLIVTFTNAAAAEMRSRIEKRLYEESAKRPYDLALKKQKYLISSAKICTIDSFCIDLVRANFQRLGINPDFKIVTGENLELISNRVLGSLLTERIEQGGEAFYRLLELTGCEYDESRLAEAIKNIFNYGMITPFPESFFEGLVTCYQSEFDRGNDCYNKAFKVAREAILSICELVSAGYDAALDLGEDGIKYKEYFEAFREICDNLLSVADSEDWNSLKQAIDSFVMPPVPRVTKLKDNKNLILMRQVRESVLSRRDSLCKIFMAKREEIEAQNRELYPAVRLLIDLVKEYRQNLFMAQCEENSLTFYNTEQLALELLCYEDSAGNVVLKEDAFEYFGQFDEVLVDEYQDVNDLQDMLFYVLSNKERNLFAVGDVKQSIYGFRGANPNNFLKKKNRYIPVALAKEEDAKKIILANNFRSRNEVCEYINYFFENIMTAENGPIVYDSEERLVATAEFPSTDALKNRLVLIDNIKNSDDDRLTIEADAIAMQIRQVMSEGECIRSKNGGLRKAEYSDFAILLRSTANVAAEISAELEKQGIPVDYSPDSFIELLEVDTFLALLKIIDNPADDIALLTVLMSPIFGFTAEELAVLRAQNKQGDLISVLASQRYNNSHVDSFYKSLEYYRSTAAVMPLGSFVYQLITITGYGDIVSAMSDGSRRRANLLKLCEYASAYEEGFGTSISGFVNYMKKTAGAKLSSAKVSSGANAVRIMSIHASKGLQFPVCILANLDAKFNMRDSSDSMLFSSKTGVGFRFFDEKNKSFKDTVARAIISEEMRLKTLEEELRLLYVAMTRAEETLIMVSAYNNLEKKLTDLSARLLGDNGRISKQSYLSAASMGDWLLMTALYHPDGKKLRGYCAVELEEKNTDSKLKISVIDAQSVDKKILLEEKTDELLADNTLTEQIKSNISYKYPFDALRGIEAKCSASTLANKAEGDKYAFKSRPSFMERDGITGADRGTALHKVMQFISFDASSIKEEIERLYEWEYISEAEKNVIDIKLIEQFFASDIFARIKRSPDCRREMRFLTEISAQEIDDSLTGELAEEKVIIQGAVDLCFVENGNVVILDFKSDRVDSADGLKAAYSEQLNIYQKAVEKIFDMPVLEKIIYSFALSEEISVDLAN